jgi:hypothetical protein
MKTTVLLLLLALCTPLAAADSDALLLKLWPEDPPKVKEIVEKAELDLLKWLNALAAQKTPAETHFDEGVSYLIESANERNGVLTIRRRDRMWDDAGGTFYKPVDETLERHISEWPSRYALITFSPDKNEDDKAVVAFAIWLYERKTKDKNTAFCGNRAMTEVYRRTEGLQPEIGAWVKEADFKGKGGDLSVCDLWDPEFRKQRKALLTPEALEDLTGEKEKQAKREFQRISYEFKNPRHRKSTMVELVTDIIHYQGDYAGTQEYAKNKDKSTKLRDEMDAQLAEVKKLLEEGNKFAEQARADKAAGKGTKVLATWRDAALKYHEAIQLDPASYPLLTRIANAWLEAGNPHYKGGEDTWTCTYKDYIQYAMPHWQKLVDMRPGDTTLMLNLGLCYQVLEKHTEADRVYTQVVKIDGTGKDGTEASRRIQQMTNPGEKRAEREDRRRRKEERERKAAEEREKEKEKGGEG